MTKQERLHRYEAARKRANDVRVAHGLDDDEAEAVTITRANRFDGEEVDAVVVCWRCEEGFPMNGNPIESADLHLFWHAHRGCVPEEGAPW
jgi:hypothetical protein